MEVRLPSWEVILEVSGGGKAQDSDHWPGSSQALPVKYHPDGDFEQTTSDRYALQSLVSAAAEKIGLTT